MIVVLLSLPTISHAQFLPADRSIDWQPGIPGGVPNYPVSSTLTPANNQDITNELQSAIDSAPAYTAILIGSGTFRLNETIDIDKSIVVRGSGHQNTILQSTHGVNILTNHMSV